MDDRAPLPSRSAETVEVDGQTVALRSWEGELLIGAGGWIVVLRGMGLAAALLAASLALFPHDAHLGWLLLARVLPAVGYAAIGVGILCRVRACRLGVLCLAIAWIALVAWAAPGLFRLGQPFEVHKLASHPLLLMLLPAYFMPDIFAACAVYSRDARPWFRPSKEPLPSILGAFRVRRTGRMLVAMGMVALACASAALCAFFAPGLALL